MYDWFFFSSSIILLITSWGLPWTCWIIFLNMKSGSGIMCFRQNSEATQTASKCSQRYWRELEAWSFHYGQSSSYIKETLSNVKWHPIQVISQRGTTLGYHNVTFCQFTSRPQSRTNQIQEDIDLKSCNLLNPFILLFTLCIFLSLTIYPFSAASQATERVHGFKHRCQSKVSGASILAAFYLLWGNYNLVGWIIKGAPIIRGAPDFCGRQK